MPTISETKPSGSRRFLRLAVAFGLWGGTAVGLAWMAVNVMRFANIPGFALRSAILGVAFLLFSGAAGYLLYSGMILGD